MDMYPCRLVALFSPRKMIFPSLGRTKGGVLPWHIIIIIIIFFVFFAFYSSFIALYHMYALWLLEPCYLGCFWRVFQAWLCAWWSGADRVPLDGVWCIFFLFLVFHIVLIYCCMLHISLDWWLNALWQWLCSCLLPLCTLVDICCSPC